MFKDRNFITRALVYCGPLALLWLWLQFGYTHRYATVTSFVLRNQQDATMALGAAGILGGGGQEQQDLHMIREYILSPNLLERLDKELHLRAAYASSDILPPQRLPSDATAEAYLELYRERVDVAIDSTSGIMTMEVQGFDPALVLKQAELTLRDAERYVNEAFHQIADRQTVAARQTLEEARRERVAKSDQLLAFQKANQTFRPDQDGAAALSSTAGLEAALASEKARAAGLRGYLSEKAPVLQESEARIAALQDQIAKERARLVGANGTSAQPGFNQLLASYQLLQLELDLATQRYSDALDALQRAQITASENLKSLVVVSSPALPEQTTYPRVWVWLLLAAVIHLFTTGPIASLFPAKRVRKKDRERDRDPERERKKDRERDRDREHT